MSRTIPIALQATARFVEVEPKNDDSGTQLLDSTGTPIWRFRCLIGTEVRAVSAPAKIDEVKNLKSFAPIHFSGLEVGSFKDHLYLKATGLDQNPEGLPLRRR